MTAKISKYLEKAQQISNGLNQTFQIKAATKHGMIRSVIQNPSFSALYVLQTVALHFMVRMIERVKRMKRIFMIQLYRLQKFQNKSKYLQIKISKYRICVFNEMYSNESVVVT